MGKTRKMKENLLKHQLPRIAQRLSNDAKNIRNFVTEATLKGYSLEEIAEDLKKSGIANGIIEVKKLHDFLAILQ